MEARRWHNRPPRRVLPEDRERLIRFRQGRRNGRPISGGSVRTPVDLDKLLRRSHTRRRRGAWRVPQGDAHPYLPLHYLHELSEAQLRRIRPSVRDVVHLACRGRRLVHHRVHAHAGLREAWSRTN